MPSIIANRFPIADAEKDQLRTMFASPAWSTLREIVSARCVEAQAHYLDASMYETENASDAAATAKASAKRFNTTMDVLDEAEKNMDEWYRITLEQRR